MDKKELSLNDSDIELSDVASNNKNLTINSDSKVSRVTNTKNRNIKDNNDSKGKNNEQINDVDGNDDNNGNEEEEEEEEDDDDDEDSILQRLTGNYRRFSETRRLSNYNDHNDENRIQTQTRNLNGNNAGDESDTANNNVNNDINNDEEENEDDEDDEDDDDDDEEEDDDFARSTALRMLANAISNSSRSSSNNRFTEFENLLSGRFLSSENRNNNNNDSNNNYDENNNTNERTQMARLLFDQLIPSPGSSKISNLLKGLKTQRDPYLIMETLNEISNSLLMMTSIQSERQVPTFKLAETLVKIINEYPDDLELQLVACRCIYNLSEVNFELIFEIISAGVIECLNSKLLDLSYIDMAEQALQALEIISRKAGKQCLNKGSIPIVLMYLDFFTIHAQRKALKIAANSSKIIPISKIDDISQVFPIIKNVATQYTDSQCVESSWIFISNVIKNFHRDPHMLSSLIDAEFLKKICSIFPLCLGNGSKSSGLVTFKTGITLLDSLSLLAIYSSKFSNDLLSNCQISSMIINIFSSYENDNNSKSKNSKVSINALLKCPKELLITNLKLISSILPINSSLLPTSLIITDSSKNNHNENNILDIGDYIALSKENIKINSEKVDLITSELTPLNDFYSSLFPLLLNIYDATVEYKVRRLVFISILRMICLMSKDQLNSIVYTSKVTSILASTITHGKYLLQNKITKLKNPQIIKLYSLIFGSLLIVQCLINRNPKLYLEIFNKEGISHSLTELNDAFKLEYDKIVDNSSDSKITGSYNNVHNTHDNNSMDRYSNETNEENHIDEDEIAQEEEIEDEDADQNQQEYEDEGENEDEDEYEYEYEYGGDNDSINGFEGFIESARSFHSYKNMSQGSNILNDGLNKLSMRSIIGSIISLLNLIDENSKILMISNNVNKSENIVFLEKLSSVLKDNILSTSENEWIDIWKKFANLLDFKTNPNSISSFELVSSGIVNALLQAFNQNSKENSLAYNTFQYIFCSTLSPCVDEKTSPLYFLVKKLEESLDRNEAFDIVTLDSDVTQNTKYRAASMTKQMKIKLIPLDTFSDVNDKNKNVLLVVQAIATFESIQNFIKNSKSINLKKTLNLNTSSLDNDYHYEFYIDNEKIPFDATIFGVIYKASQAKGPSNILKENLLREIHVIKYKYVPGKLVSDDHPIFEESVNDALYTIGEKNIIDTLQLLKSLHIMNLNVLSPSTSEIIFLNYKLSAKLNRQLDEPLLVASGILPEWAIIIPRQFPFLFPLETRLFFLKSTSFGYSRLIDHWSSKSKDEGQNASDFNARNPMLGRSIRHKLRISREKIFSSAIKVMENYATNPGLIEIEYFDEVGSGLGPTLEFYSNVSKEFSKIKLWMWRSDKYSTIKSTNNVIDLYIHDANGLFPRPMSNSDLHFTNTLLYFKVLGKFLAKSFLDSRLVDFHFNPLFFEIAMKYAISNDFRYDLDESIKKIRKIDEVLGSSLQHLQLYLKEFHKLPQNEWSNVEVSGAKVEDLMLTFVLPGYEEIQLIPNGNEVEVNSNNLEEYLNKIIDFTIYSGIKSQIASFVNGFSEIFPFTSMILFSSNELTRLSGNETENWSVETLISVIHADHGYNSKSDQIQWLIEIMSNFDNEDKRKFLKFITGSPRLPFDGFKGLSPPFTVVLKHCENDLKPDDYLPSVMTCANYLKLPSYSSLEVMQAKIVQAMNEGNNSFLLS